MSLPFLTHTKYAFHKQSIANSSISPILFQTGGAARCLLACAVNMSFLPRRSLSSTTLVSLAHIILLFSSAQTSSTHKNTFVNTKTPHPYFFYVLVKHFIPKLIPTIVNWSSLISTHSSKTVLYCMLECELLFKCLRNIRFFFLFFF